MDSSGSKCSHKDITCLDNSLVACLSCGEVISINTTHQIEQPQQNEQVSHPDLVPTNPLAWPTSVKYAESATEHEIAKTLELIEKTACPVQPINLSSAQKPVGHENALESEPFTYPDLQSATEIRLLELFPGHRREALHGRLLTTGRNDSPAYDAISYTWADDKNDITLCRRIFLGDNYRPLPITLNCDRALRSVRQKDCKVILWIDSICINQSSLSERSHQVSLMNNIYSRAENVHIYAGEETCGEDQCGDEALRFLKNMDEFEANSHLARSILDTFFSRPYFSRLWVVQEVLLAKALVLHCGEESMSLPRGSIARLEDKFIKVPPWISLFGRNGLLSLISSDELAELLSSTAACNMSDLRDRVFGLLGLIHDAELESVHADYNLMVREVYIGVAAYLLLNKKQYHVLQLAITEPNSHMRETYGIPSWVPLWNSSLPTNTNFDTPSLFQLLEQDFEKFILPKTPLFKSYKAGLLRGRCLDSTPKIWDQSCCSLQVHGKTGSLITPGYELLSLGRDLLNPLENRYVLNNLETQEMATDFWEFESGTFLALRALGCVLLKTRAAYQHGHHIRVISIHNSETLFLATKNTIGGSQIAYELLCPCIVGVIYQSKDVLVNEPYAAEDPRFLHQFYPLKRNHLRFLSLWRHILTLKAQPHATPGNERSVDHDSGFMTLADGLSQTENFWSHYHGFTEATNPLGPSDEFTSWLSGLLNFWDGQALKSVYKIFNNDSKMQSIVKHFRNWTSAMSGLNIAAIPHYQVDRFGTPSGGRFYLSQRLSDALETWRSESKYLSGLLEDTLGLNFILKSHGQIVRVAPKLVDQVYDSVQSYLTDCKSEEEIISKLSQTVMVGSADWHLVEIMLSSLVGVVGQLDEVRRIIMGRKMVHQMFISNKSAAPIVVM